MKMIVLRLLSLLSLKSRWHRDFSPRPLNKVFFQGGGVSVDSWTLGPKPLCHRHPTGPHPSGLLWTPWTPAKGASTKSNFALGLLHPRGADDLAKPVRADAILVFAVLEDRSETRHARASGSRSTVPHRPSFGVQGRRFVRQVQRATRRRLPPWLRSSCTPECRLHETDPVG